MQAAGINPNQYLFDAVNILERDAALSQNNPELRDRAIVVQSLLEESRAVLREDFAALARRVVRILEPAAPAAAPVAALAPKKNIRSSEVTKDAVQETFYNIMADLALSEEGMALDLRQQNVKVLFAAKSIVSALLNSKNTPSLNELVLTNGGILTQENCPQPYPRLAGALFAIKKSVVDLPPAALNQVDANIMTPEKINNPDLQRLVATIKTMAKEICQLDSFKEIIDKVTLNLAEIRGNVVSSHAPTEESLRGVDQQLVRDSFYSLMTEHTKAYKYVPKDRLADREHWAYFVLTAHTLIEVLVRSQNLTDAIALRGNKALTLGNCPAEYLPLAKTILGMKTKIPYLNQEQIDYIKYLILPDDEKIAAVPENVKHQRSDELDRIVSILNQVGLLVSEIPNFKVMIERVLDDCTKQP